MSAPDRFAAAVDLLEERRRLRGLPPPEPLPARPLLLRGVALGGVPLLLALLLGLAVQWRQQQVAVELEGLRAIPQRVQRLEGQILAARRQWRRFQRSSEGLARGVVAVQSGSALLTQLAAITPLGVQLADLRVQGDQLLLKGVAVDPQAFRRVNGLSLLLERSPLVQSEGVQVVKLSREQPSSPLAWELTARFASLRPAEQLQVLQRLQAAGLVRRLQLLQRAGVLP